MDTITQAALGAAVGEVGWRRQLGGRGVLWGMICGLLPDLDVVAGLAGPWASLVFHRSWTHSLVVLPLVTPLVGWVGKRVNRSDAPLSTWIALSGWALITHPLLDVFTTYGTQLFAPLTDRRFSLDGVSILDPVYTVPLLLALAVARLRSVPLRTSRLGVAAALTWGVAYLGLGCAWSEHARAAGLADLAAQGVLPEAVRTPPMMLLGPNRKVVARKDGALWVGVMSAWADDTVSMRPVDQQHGPAAQAVLDTPEGRIWAWFADDYLQIATEAGADGATTVRLSDQKYGRYLAPTSSVFVVESTVSATGLVGEVVQRRNVDGLDVAAEFAAGWALAMGGAEALNAAAAHPPGR